MHKDGLVGFMFASAGPVTASVVGMDRDWCCDPSALKGGYEGVWRRRSVLHHRICLDASFHWDPRSSSSTKAWHRLKQHLRTKTKLLIKTELILAAGCRHLSAL